MRNLLSVDELAGWIAAGRAPRILDVRWRLGCPDGHAEYLSGHVPGAVYVSLGTELSAPGRPEEGRHPLPTTAALQASARRWGLRAGDRVVAYDNAQGAAAARAWWLLRQAGVDVRVLDGGLRAWVAAGHALEPGEVTPPAGDVELAVLGRDAITIDEAAAFPSAGILLDVRAPERYRGESEPLDPVAGHIPGAINLPTSVHLDSDGRLLDAETLRAQFAQAGVTADTPVAAYCGSGVTAAHTALALAEAGLEAKLFPGSWSQWSNTSGRPVATGPAAGIPRRS